MSEAKLPRDPDEYFELVQQGNLDNQTLVEEIQKHGTHQSCDVCDALFNQDLGQSIVGFLVESHAESVDAKVIELALSLISEWAHENLAHHTYLSIALNPNSSRETLEKAFEWMEDYAIYGEVMQEGEDYFAEILGRIATHPQAPESELRSWISHNHYMFGELTWEGHDEVEDDDFDACEKCLSLFEAAMLVPKRDS